MSESLAGNPGPAKPFPQKNLSLNPRQSTCQSTTDPVHHLARCMTAAQMESGRRLGCLRAWEARLTKQARKLVREFARLQLAYQEYQGPGSPRPGEPGVQVVFELRERDPSLSLSSPSQDQENTRPPLTGRSSVRKSARAGIKRLANGDVDYQAYPDFLRFWEIWPKKDAKEEALIVWLGLKPTPELQELILESVQKHLVTDWLGKERRFIKNPDSWLRWKRWQDQGDPAGSRPRGQAQRAFDVYIAEELEKERHEQGTNGTHRPEAL